MPAIQKRMSLAQKKRGGRGEGNLGKNSRLKSKLDEHKDTLTARTRKILLELDDSPEFDSKFINILLGAFFTQETLANSSYGGGMSNYTGTQSEALDADKMEITKCK